MVLVSNDLLSINDVTLSELVDIVSKVLLSINDVTYSELVEIVSNVKEIKNGTEYILEVEAKNLLIVNFGTDLCIARACIFIK